MTSGYVYMYTNSLIIGINQRAKKRVHVYIFNAIYPYPIHKKSFNKISKGDLFVAAIYYLPASIAECFVFGRDCFI